jgi:hypothetical protein
MSSLDFFLVPHFSIRPYLCNIETKIISNIWFDPYFRGAGKTTFLNVLAHRKIEQLEVTGTVYVRQEPVGINIREVSAYVEDNDVFVGSLTVREHLIFQVWDACCIHAVSGVASPKRVGGGRESNRPAIGGGRGPWKWYPEKCFYF